jgi:hypothetical protein
MIARGNGGSIVNISSQASQSALKDHTVYCKWIEFIVYCTFAPRSPMASFPACLLVLVISSCFKLCTNLFLYVPFLSWAQSPSYSFQTYCARNMTWGNNHCTKTRPFEQESRWELMQDKMQMRVWYYFHQLLSLFDWGSAGKHLAAPAAPLPGNS